MTAYLGKKTCACRAWQLTGYPCVYAYVAISNLDRDPEDYVSPWLTATMFDVDVASDGDSEVQMEPDSEVESYEVYFEEDSHRYEDVDQPEVAAEAQGHDEGVVGGIEEKVEVELQVEALVEVEVQDGEDQATVAV
ncbi:unnamed protein product [Lactuca saligna]|uniref:Zinc finger PMZ-type domain-containing protein n=1 Tax=Lactuca saligna TaxID=75948 RepID=A0AA36E813_LACSI|nr:unnamed protein product [Lactuca saligna]